MVLARRTCICYSIVAKRALHLIVETCNSQNMLGLIPALSAHERFIMKPLLSHVVLLSSFIDLISIILLESEKVSFSLRLNPQHTQPQSLELVLKIISRELFCKCKARLQVGRCSERNIRRPNIQLPEYSGIFTKNSLSKMGHFVNIQ